MKRLFVLLTAALLGVAALGGYLLLAPRGHKMAAQAGQVEDLGDEVKRLRQEVALVRAQAANTAARQVSAAAQLASAATGDTAGKASPANDSRHETREERVARARAALAVWYSAIDGHMAKEALDPAWSPQAVAGAQALMAKHNTRAALQATDCGSTMCRIVVSHADQDAQREFAAEMADEAQLDTEVVYKYDTDTTPPTTTMWVARKGHHLPRAPRN